ncbi:UNVERIFIED_CONTAM: hypothetical protein GTU68_062307, partial [Idotea baltica]|nr:hypothetical protein [Idotea baltica]
VLANIFLKINKGHIYGLIGPNGAGKSTLFKSILGLIDAGTGTININGQPRSNKDTSIAYVPQRDDVDWDFPAVVMDIVLMGRYPYKKIWQRLNKSDHAIAAAALADLEIAHLKDRQIGQLSGGQQQRVFIARALCQQADIFLLDEPFVGVDIATENSIIRILKRLADQGKTLMVVHHDLSTVKNYFDKIILLNQRLIAYGDTDAVFTDDNIAKAYGAQLNILHQSGIIGQ